MKAIVGSIVALVTPMQCCQRATCWVDGLALVHR